MVSYLNRFADRDRQSELYFLPAGAWSPHRDLNPGPLPYQGSALPLSYVGIDLLSALYLLLERVMGIEPTSSAWKAEVLPLNYTRLIFPLLHAFFGRAKILTVSASQTVRISNISCLFPCACGLVCGQSTLQKSCYTRFHSPPGHTLRSWWRG